MSMTTKIETGSATEATERRRVVALLYNELPERSRRAVRGGPEMCEIVVRLEVVTPILGGGSQTRELDEVEIIRAATIRGHLRFWWRALYADQCSSSEELYQREGALWGRATSEAAGGRSVVEIRVDVEKHGDIDKSDINLYDSKNGKKTLGAYALWPARSETSTGTAAAPRRCSGTRFRLMLRVPADTGLTGGWKKSRETQVRNAVRAWILFGGYGGRTRRGVGSLTVIEDRGAWLPSAATRGAFEELFGFDIFATQKNGVLDVPKLQGAALHMVGPQKQAEPAWITALAWVQDFRQGCDGTSGHRAREPGTGKPQPSRPSISNWPEADKVRHLRQKTKGHPPNHNSAVAWPRAGFGLPIIGQFQKNDRSGGRYDEPSGFELLWRSTTAGKAGKFDNHDRLASPLIVKALPLADGTFAPCALWLNRAYPDGKVILKDNPNSAALFDQLVAKGDTPQFLALANKTGLRQAFLDWLHAKYQTTKVAP